MGVLSDSDLKYLTAHHQICYQAKIDRSLATMSKQEMSALAERIKEGIATDGIHVISRVQMRIALGHCGAISDQEMGLHLQNFCYQYGFTAISEDDSATIVFRGIESKGRCCSQ